MRSARNIPVRESSFAKIRDFQEQQNKNNRALQMMPGNLGSFAGYGANYYNQQPQFNGNNMFIPGMLPGIMNMGNQQSQVNYNKINLERVSSCVEFKFKKPGKNTALFEGPYP